MRRLIAASLLLSLAACDTASVPLAGAQADAEGKAFPAPPPGKAALYIVRGGDGGTLINITVGARQLGPLGNHTWFREDVTPGTLDVRCAGGESSQALDLPIAVGETRFVQVKPAMGWAAVRCTIAEVAAAHGRETVLWGKRARDLR